MSPDSSVTSIPVPASSNASTSGRAAASVSPFIERIIGGRSPETRPEPPPMWKSASGPDISFALAGFDKIRRLDDPSRRRLAARASHPEGAYVEYREIHRRRPLGR